MVQCPNCGFSDRQTEAEHGYDVSDEDTRSTTRSWQDESEFDTELSTPGRRERRCPECGETF